MSSINKIKGRVRVCFVLMDMSEDSCRHTVCVCARSLVSSVANGIRAASAKALTTPFFLPFLRRVESSARAGRRKKELLECVCVCFRVDIGTHSVLFFKVQNNPPEGGEAHTELPFLSLSLPKRGKGINNMCTI